MDTIPIPDRDRITIAILALGGQGGGVLADWILELASTNGYVAQGTSVPGVAQRTGSTVYYIEMVRRAPQSANRHAPVLAMMPVPGDVDIVIASELIETGRAILRGFVSADRTTLIGSTHRIYAISEKSALGDGIAAGQRIIDAAGKRARRFIGFDMDAAAARSGTMISSVMFGALAGSGALPFPPEAFEAAIRRGGKAVASNLKGLAAGQAGAHDVAAPAAEGTTSPQPTTYAGKMLAARILGNLPEPAQPFALEGARRLMDYQDARYAALYLDRLETIRAVDDGGDDWRLTRETARHLALWMAYEDTIRVADLKVRATRSARVAAEVRLAPEQVMTVTEYMHPRLREVCETMPAVVGRWILDRPALSKRLERLFAKGRHVRTTSIRWFIALRLLASLRAIRRSTLRYGEEQIRIERWLAFAGNTAERDPELAAEIIATQRLLKGYGDTFERGLANFDRIMAAAHAGADVQGAASTVRALRDAALADDRGTALDALLAATRTAA